MDLFVKFTLISELKCKTKAEYNFFKKMHLRNIGDSVTIYVPREIKPMEYIAGFFVNVESNTDVDWEVIEGAENVQGFYYLKNK